MSGGICLQLALAGALLLPACSSRNGYSPDAGRSDTSIHEMGSAVSVSDHDKDDKTPPAPSEGAGTGKPPREDHAKERLEEFRRQRAPQTGVSTPDDTPDTTKKPGAGR
ncbi:MAG TPA: hypothetical protein VGC80_10815 [Acetobacteraceae bacterium]|jgi:hypothetical protein